MRISFEADLFVYRCECEYQFALWSPVSKDVVWGNQTAKHCPQCGSTHIIEVEDSKVQE